MYHIVCPPDFRDPLTWEAGDQKKWLIVPPENFDPGTKKSDAPSHPKIIFFAGDQKKWRTVPPENYFFCRAQKKKISLYLS